MTRIVKPKRAKRANKHLDLTDIRAALLDRRVWTALGVVIAPADGSPHWRIAGNHRDVMVEVELQPDQHDVTARLAAGMWIVPELGDEVAVMLPSGHLDFMPIITCILAHKVPSIQGPQPRRVVIVADEVVIHDGNGGAEKLVRKSEFDNHTHVGGTMTAGGDAVLGTSAKPAPIAGTTVLKA